MGGNMLCKLNVRAKYSIYEDDEDDDIQYEEDDIQYEVFQHALINSLFFFEMSESKRDFYIVQNENIIWCSNYPHADYFKRKLNISDPFQCMFPSLKTNTLYKDLFNLLETNQDNSVFQKAMQDLPYEYKDNAEFMAILCAFSYFQCFCYASTRLRNDKEFCFSICEKNAYAVHFVIAGCSDKLQNDKSFILKLIEYNPDAILYAHKNILANKF